MQASPLFPSLWFRACLYFGSHTSCKNTAENTDLPHRCALEVASKNDFKTFRNRHALRKCLLKTNKIAKIEGKTSSQPFCVCFKEVGVVSLCPRGLGCGELGPEKQAGPLFHNRVPRRVKNSSSIFTGSPGKAESFPPSAIIILNFHK